MGYRLPQPLPQAKQSSSGQTLWDPDNNLKQDCNNNHKDEPIEQKLQGEQQKRGTEQDYLKSEHASNESSGTEGAINGFVTLLSDCIVNLRIKFASGFGIPGVTQPESTTTEASFAEGLVVVQTKSSLLLEATNNARDEKNAFVRLVALKSALVQNSLQCCLLERLFVCFFPSRIRGQYVRLRRDCVERRR